MGRSLLGGLQTHTQTDITIHTHFYTNIQTHYCTHTHIDTHAHITTLNCAFIRGQPDEQMKVNSFKYLGLTIDNKLNFNKHVITTHKRAHHRLYVIRKLKSLSVAPHLLLLLYKSIQPILMYCSPCFFTLLTVTSETRLLQIPHIASKINKLTTT